MPHDNRYVVMRCVGSGRKECMVKGDSPEEVYEKLGEQIGAIDISDDEDTDMFGFGAPNDDDLLGGY